MDLIGIYNSDGTEVTTFPYNVVPSGEYYALILLQIPKGKPYTSGNVFFIGDAKTQADSSILIKSSKILFGQETKGLTYNAPMDYANDMLNKTADNALWSSLNISKINSGSTLARVDFSVVGEPKNNLFKLGYRASLKSGSSYLRYHEDKLLGQNESTAEKLGFYADTKNISFISGNLVCSNIACIDLRAQDSTGYKTQLGQEAVLYSQYNADTVLHFEIIPAIKSSINNLTLQISTKNSGIDISSVDVVQNGKPLTVNGKGSYTVNINSFDSTASIEGNLGFTSTKEGDTILTISLLSDKEAVFSKDIKISVDSAKNLVAEYLPSIIVPYVLNLGAIVVTDANEKMPISNALVNVYLNDVLLTSGKTDDDGKLPVQIAKPNAGDVLKMVVTYAGYNTNTTTMKITENILIPDKPEISINVDKTEKDTINTNVLLATTLQYKLKINKVKFTSSDFEEFVDVKVTNVNNNTVIDSNLDLNIYAQLTQLGKALLEPKTFNTNLELVVSSDDLAKTWTIRIPVVIYVRMFDSIDSLNCLKLTNDNNGTTSFKITNSCMYKDNPAQLYKATLFVEWDGQKLGDYEYNGKKIIDDGLLMYDIQTPLKSKTTTFNLKFNSDPALASGQSKMTLILKAYFPTQNGLQELTASKEEMIIVSDLTKCLKVMSPNGTLLTADTVIMQPVVLGVTSVNMGNGMLNGMYNNMLSAYPMFSATNGYPLGTGVNNMYGLGGTTYYQNNALGNYNTYDSILNTTSMQNPSIYWGGQQSYSTGIPGYGAQTSTALNNGTATNSTTAGAQTVYPNYANRNSATNFWTQSGFSNNINIEDDMEENNNKILFEYPYTPVGMNPMLGTNAYNMYGMQSPYMMGGYGAMMQNNYLPPMNTLTFINQCNETINLEIRSMPQIYVSPNTLTLTAGQKNKITLMSSSLPGTFTMNVLAGTQNNILPLMTIPVNVIDYASNTVTDKCFKLSEEPVINMSDVLKRNKIMKVYNYCYSKGVVFDDAQPVSIENLFTREPVTAKGNDDLRISENTPYASVAILGVPSVNNSSTYGQYQELSIVVSKSTAIQRIVRENLARNN